jgi:hypothetical protein
MIITVKKCVKIYKSPTSWEAMDINGEHYDPSSGGYETNELT